MGSASCAPHIHCRLVSIAVQRRASKRFLPVLRFGVDLNMTVGWVDGRPNVGSSGVLCLTFLQVQPHPSQTTDRRLEPGRQLNA